MNDAICTSCDEPCKEEDINSEGECPSCAPTYNEDEDDGPEHCQLCNGTGEGQVDGTRCTAPDCDGGAIRPKPERDEPEPDNDFDDRDYGPYGYSPE